MNQSETGIGDKKLPMELYAHSCRNLYSVRKRENADQNNSEFEHFLRSGFGIIIHVWGKY